MSRRVLSIDLETYSDVDLPNCGVYRYVEGDFHILLLAYAFDDEETKCIDMACGEQLPAEVVNALHDDSIIKSAWNAQFERTCLSKYLGTPLSPDSWQCTMVWAASLSLPLKLATAAQALKTAQQKDSVGERLIRYFSLPCKPTKANGGRTRNLPEHAPDDWKLFKSYCIQDVNTERDIRRRLEMFGVPVVKHGINGELRQKGKVAELACGYGGGSGALISMGALDMGLKEDELPDIITSWRDANPEIVKFWYAVEKSAIETVKDHKDRTVGRIGFQFSANTLWIVLPSGRRLAYIKPKLQPNRFGRMALTFEGLGANNKWTRGETYSGKLTENITQATARDLLAEAMRRMELAGLDIVGHVHDEVILEVPKGSMTVDDVCTIMNQNPAWADGLPLSSAGYTGNYYYKD